MANILTVQNVITRVQRTFGDEAAVQVQQADVLRWINDAQREAVMQNEGLLQKVDYLDLVAGQSEYTLPADCFIVAYVWVKSDTTTNYYMLKWLPMKAMNEQLDGYAGNAFPATYPVVYTSERPSTLFVYPQPEASVAQGIKLQYSRFATEVVDSGSTIDLPPEYGTFVVNYCLMQAYEMDEDWESAGQKAQQVQGDLDFNNNRQYWFGRDSYPTISYAQEDMN